MNKRKQRVENGSGDAMAEVREVYKDLAKRPVERNCTGRTECCQFMVTGRVPYLTRGEALVAAHGWRATGRKALMEKENGVCPMLDEERGRCMIYENRPFGCRTHFCRAAGGNIEREEVIDLIRRLEAVDAAMGGEGARPLRAAVEAALEEGRR